jgi:hypothetical protein
LPMMRKYSRYFLKKWEERQDNTKMEQELRGSTKMIEPEIMY